MIRVYQILIILAILFVERQVEGNVLHGQKIPPLALLAIVVIFLWALYKIRCYMDRRTHHDDE